MNNLPTPRDLVQLPDGTWTYATPPAAPAVQPQIVHVHQAPPDRTVQRLAVGAGMGGGAIAAGVYFGPLLVAAMTSIAVSLAVAALVVAMVAWAVNNVIKSIGGPDGQEAAKSLSKARKRH